MIKKVEKFKLFLIFFSVAVAEPVIGQAIKNDRHCRSFFVIVMDFILSVVLGAELAHHSTSLPHLGLAHLAEFLLQLLAIVGL